MTLLAVENLSARFPEGTALRDLSLTLKRGERIGLVGESGSGKTMAGLAVMGMAPEAATVSGAIRFDGLALHEMGEAARAGLRGRRMAMIFQEPMTALNPLQRIGTQIAEALLWHRLADRAGAAERALALLEEVDMPEPAARLQQYPHELSGGQRQRAMIAMALACGPELLIADEPTTALDVLRARQVLDLLRRLSETRGMALILISHDLEAVERVAERLVVFYGGDLVEDGATARVLARPAHPYTEGLIRARPRQPLPTIAGRVPQLAEMPEGCRFHARCPRRAHACTTARPALTPLHAEQGAACLFPTVEP